MMCLHRPSQGKTGFKMGSPKGHDQEEKEWAETLSRARSQSKDYLCSLDFY